MFQPSQGCLKLYKLTID